MVFYDSRCHQFAHHQAFFYVISISLEPADQFQKKHLEVLWKSAGGQGKKARVVHQRKLLMSPPSVQTWVREAGLCGIVGLELGSPCTTISLTRQHIGTPLGKWCVVAVRNNPKWGILERKIQGQYKRNPQEEVLCSFHYISVQHSN